MQFHVYNVTSSVTLIWGAYEMICTRTHDLPRFILTDHNLDTIHVISAMFANKSELMIH